MKGQSTFAIEDENSLTQWIEKDHMLLIIDIHLNWTESCEVLRPCFDQAYKQYERAKERFTFLTMEGQRFADVFESMVTFSESCRISLDDIVPIVDGDGDNGDTSNSTDLGERMKTLLRKEGKGCSPLFLAVKGRKVISIVSGASYPALAKIVDEHIPKISTIPTLDL